MSNRPALSLGPHTPKPKMHIWQMSRHPIGYPLPSQHHSQLFTIWHFLLFQTWTYHHLHQGLPIPWQIPSSHTSCHWRNRERISTKSLPDPHRSKTQVCSKKWWIIQGLMSKHSILLRCRLIYGTCPVYRNGGLKSNFWKLSKRSVKEQKKNGRQDKETRLSSYQAHPRTLTVRPCQIQGPSQALAGRFGWGKIRYSFSGSQSPSIPNSQLAEYSLSICSTWQSTYIQRWSKTAPKNNNRRTVVLYQTRNQTTQHAHTHSGPRQRDMAQICHIRNHQPTKVSKYNYI